MVIRLFSEDHKREKGGGGSRVKGVGFDGSSLPCI